MPDSSVSNLIWSASDAFLTSRYRRSGSMIEASEAGIARFQLDANAASNAGGSLSFTNDSSAAGVSFLDAASHKPYSEAQSFREEAQNRERAQALRRGPGPVSSSSPGNAMTEPASASGVNQFVQSAVAGPAGRSDGPIERDAPSHGGSPSDEANAGEARESSASNQSARNDSHNGGDREHRRSRDDREAPRNSGSDRAARSRGGDGDASNREDGATGAARNGEAARRGSTSAKNGISNTGPAAGANAPAATNGSGGSARGDSSGMHTTTAARSGGGAGATGTTGPASGNQASFDSLIAREGGGDNSSGTTSPRAANSSSASTGAERGASQSASARSAAGEATNRTEPPTFVRSIMTLANTRGGSMTMKLEPESLGALRIQMSVQQGRVALQFHTQTAESGDLIRNSIETLRASLEARGLRVEQVTIQPLTRDAAGGWSMQHQQGDSSSSSDPRQQGPWAGHDAGEGRSRGYQEQRRDHSGARDRDGAPQARSGRSARSAFSIPAPDGEEREP